MFVGFDSNRNGVIEYDEFMRFIRGPLNPFRQNLVDTAFSILDKNGNGLIDVSDITGVYNGKKHPEVIAGRKTEEQILGEFLETFETHHNTFTQGTNDQIVNHDEWNEYYANVSMSIDRDDYFELMMNNAWKLGDAKKNYATGWSNTQHAASAANTNSSYGGFYQADKTGEGIQRSHWMGYTSATVDKPHYSQAVVHPQSEAWGAAPGYTPEPKQEKDTGALLKIFRENIAKRGARGIFGLARNFRIIDDNHSMTLCKQEFAKACNDFRIALGPQERDALFDAFDINNNGEIDYEEFLRGCVGEMNSI